jgi:hypothetical protein
MLADEVRAGWAADDPDQLGAISGDGVVAFSIDGMRIYADRRFTASFLPI